VNTACRTFIVSRDCSRDCKQNFGRETTRRETPAEPCVRSLGVQDRMPTWYRVSTNSTSLRCAWRLAPWSPPCACSPFSSQKLLAAKNLSLHNRLPYRDAYLYQHGVLPDQYKPPRWTRQRYAGPRNLRHTRGALVSRPLVVFKLPWNGEVWFGRAGSTANCNWRSTRCLLEQDTATTERARPPNIA